MEFMIPVRYSGISHERVTADSLEEAIQAVTYKADVKSRYELCLSSPHFDILAPRLMLSEEDKETWPFWEYGYSGVDGVDWHVGYTRDGRASIPDFAEECKPVPSDWLESWKKK